MAGRRPEDSRLSEALRIAYETAGVSQTQIAEALTDFTGGDPTIDQSKVSKWARDELSPPLWALPVIDRLCGRTKGYVLRLAELVDDDLDIDELLMVDSTLKQEDRTAIVRYRRLLQADS